MHRNLLIFLKQQWLGLIIVVWVAAATSGALAMVSYSHSPGRIGPERASCPAGGLAETAAEDFTLMMFVHPHCPCSQASLEQLARIHSRCRDRLHVQVWVFSPTDKPNTWVQTKLWNMAEHIPGSVVQRDLEGSLAARFGGHTSGHVSLYDAAGELQFNGGITAGRGHAGDNLGTSAVIAIIRGETPSRRRAPVFGCPIHPERQLAVK